MNIRLFSGKNKSASAVFTPEMETSFTNETCRTNMQRVRIFSSVAAVLFAILILIGLSNRVEGAWAGPGYEALFYAHIFSICGFIAAFILSMVMFPSSADDVRWYHRLLVSFLAIFTLTSGALIATADQLIHGQISAYILIVFALGVIIMTGFIESLVIYAFSLMVFLTGITLVQNDPDQLFGHYTNGVSLAVVAWVLSRVVYSGKRKEFAGIKTIEQQRADLAAQVEINSELMRSLKDVAVELNRSSEQMSSGAASFSDIIHQQASSIEEITAAIEEVTGHSESVRDTVKDQASSMEQLSKTMSELLGSMRDVENQVQTARGRMESISERADYGKQYMSVMDDSMGEISQTSREMANILTIINDISDQINLLSLNASIEAARAGDAGRGFAVVADEIGKLADQTTSSVKDIDALIRKGENEILKGMTSVSDSVETIGGIINGVNEIDRMIASIGDNMKTYAASNEDVNMATQKAREHFDSIASSTDEQSLSVGEIQRSIAVINELSQSNAQQADEMRALSGRIGEMARELNAKIEALSS